MSDRIQAIRGMRDILPPASRWWGVVERNMQRVLELYDYCEIRTPLLEKTALFSRSIGEQTDIVEKEMYTFADRDGTSLSLRPEGTASVVRAFVEHNLHKKQPVHRLYYLGPMFRHERPQKGRLRQFFQLGVELLGAAGPAADVEVIDVMIACVEAAGIGSLSLHVNSLGCRACRPGYRTKLVEFLEAHAESLCADCRRRLEHNPLRVLDCKQPRCVAVAEGAPHMIDHLCADCAAHFGQVRRGLESLGIGYTVNHRMVRGLDYYNRTTFELLADGLGAQNAVAAGGRYDGLVGMLGGADTPAVGFAIGLDRVLLVLEQISSPPEAPPLVFVAAEPDHSGEALRLLSRLRAAGIRASWDVRLGSFKSQLKRADKSGARLVVLVGSREVESGTVTVKDMAADDEEQKQRQVENEWLVEEVERLLEGKGRH
ncbi:MAG: histidine--tRNA ligase [Deltaproteobacteria bacterium]|nr:MAG: histidine--tRNA ligase [Deltaproteobacteria bacterium]